MNRNKFNIYAAVLGLLLPLRYRINVTGLDKISPEGSILFMPNHPALTDPLIVYSRIGRWWPRVLADAHQMDRALLRNIAKYINVIQVADPMRDGAKAKDSIRAGLDEVAAALKSGDKVLFYPAGQLYRDRKSSLGAKSGAHQLLQALPQQRVVLVRTSGLWGSRFSYAFNGQAPNPGNLKFIWNILSMLFLNLLFFIPKREVKVEFIEAGDSLRQAAAQGKMHFNAWLEEFYSAAERPNTRVPDYFWQGSTPEIVADQHRSVKGDAAGQPLELREAVIKLLRGLYDLPPQQELTLETSLARDLGLDSLSLMELGTALEAKFDYPVAKLELLETVGDCVLAAAGLLAGADAAQPIPEAWFQNSSDAVFSIPATVRNIPEAFLSQVRKDPKSPLLVDRQSMRNREELLTGAFVLAQRFKDIPGERVGVLLPATPAVTAVWLALQFVGKVPVMLNWTVGEKNLEHCLALAGVREVISAGQLMQRLERGGLPLNKLPVDWLDLEKIAASLSLKEKISGLLTAKLFRFVKALPMPEVPEVAAILFTSGSEALPKAVPLTQHNLLSNARDLITVLNAKDSDRVLAMLPPFHSFGLMVNIVLPLSVGLKAAFHANPTESGILNSLVRDYKLTLLASPPGFLGAMLDKAASKNKPDEDKPGKDNPEKNPPAAVPHGSRADAGAVSGDLASLRLGFVGAEKCPEHVYAAFTRLCPNAILCEGYGITECSPVVSVNYPDNPLPGSIGQALPSVELALVSLESLEAGKLARVQTGSTGMLLIRGPNVFSGYLGGIADPFVLFEGKKWYKSGDLVSMDENGRLFFQGRLKRFVKIGGEMISLPQMETILLEAFSNHSQAATEEGDGPILAVESLGTDDSCEIVLFTPLPLERDEVNSTLRKAGLSALYAVKRVQKVGKIPLLGTGKTDYRSLKAM